MIEDLFFKSWNTITDGSVDIKVEQEKSVVGIILDKNTLFVDIKDPGHPLLSALKNITHGIGIEGGEGKKAKKSIISDKKDRIKNLLSKAGDIAGVLAENNKTFVLKHKGKELLKLGRDAKSLIPFLRKRHIQVSSKTGLLLFLMRISTSPR